MSDTLEEHRSTFLTRERDRTPEHKEPVPTAEPRVAEVLRMQRGVGNQAVARMLAGRARSTMLLRDVTVKGEIEETKQKHHPTYRFQFGGEEQPRRHDPDDWFTGDKNQAAAHTATLDRAAVRRVIQAWDCTSSIVDDLAEEFVGHKASWPAATGTRIAEGVKTTADHTVSDAVAATEDSKKFVMHMLSLQHAMARRQADFIADLPQTLTLKKTQFKKPLKNEALALNWKPLFAYGRQQVKQQLLGGVAAPANKDNVKILTDALLAGQAGDLGVQRLVDLGLLWKGADGHIAFSTKAVKEQVAYEVTDLPKTDKGKPMSLDFGINHLSVTLWQDWRAGHEALGLAAAVEAEQPAAAKVGRGQRPAQRGKPKKEKPEKPEKPEKAKPTKRPAVATPEKPPAPIETMTVTPPVMETPPVQTDTGVEDWEKEEFS